MKLRLGCVVLAIAGWSSTALANMSANPTPVDAGNVAIGSNNTVNASVESDVVFPGSDTLDHFHPDAADPDCTLFTLTPSSTLPQNVDTLTPLPFTVQFTPAARGLVECTVALHADAAHTVGGTAFVVRGTGIAPEITAPASATFANTRVLGTTTSQQTITLQNTGDTTLSISNLAISGTDAGDFSVASPVGAFTIAPAASQDVIVVFDPSAAGARSASLDITSDDPITPTASVTLSGTGTTALIAVTDVAFGVVDLGQTGSQTIAVTNSSTNNPGTLTITSATITGGAGWFTFAANGFGCLGNATCTFGSGIVAPQNIGVRCTPPANASGLMTATVTFASDSDAGGDNVASLACTAGRADATVDPTSLAYGDVEVTVPSTKTVSVTNTGNITLTYTATKTGTRAGEYTFAGCFTACAVAAGATETFDLTFNPTSRGAANITVNVASNDPDNATIAIPVTANATAPLLSSNPAATLQFGSVEVVTTSTLALVVTNTGDADLDIATASFTTNDGSYAIVTGTTGAQTVTPGNTATWNISCTPAVQGTHDGNFRITSNALGTATKNIALRCTGTEGVLVVNPTSINFGGVAENTVATRSYTLTNTGNLAVDNIAAVLDPNNVGYSLDPATPIPTTLAAGAASTLNVKFAPQNGNDGGPATVTFSGTWGTGAKPLRAPPVLGLDGDGLVSGFDVTPDPVDFGDMRFDTPGVTRTFCIVNTEQAALSITSTSITPDVGTQTGEFVVSAIRRKTCGTANNPAPVNLPQALAAGQQLEVSVVANPADRTGAMSATLTVASDLATNPTRTTKLVGNSTTAALALSCTGGVCEFGAVDVQGAPATQDVTITNTGAAPLDLAAFTRSDGGANSHFQLALPPNTTLAPTEALTIAVTYAPAVVTVPDESIVLSSGVAGVFGGPATQTITLRGRGIDREIDVVMNADTSSYRNPGDAAPITPVVVTNFGEVELVISGAMLTEDNPQLPEACAPAGAVWQLENPDPVTVGPGQSHTFNVRFSPFTAGYQSQAHLIISNDDSDEAMARVDLAGSAIDRNVAFGGGDVIDLGFTGIGIPITLDDVLTVQNMNAVDGFRITRIDLADAKPFALVDAPAGAPLGALGEEKFSLAFEPETEGMFETTATLFVDDDPCAQATVKVRGTAVFVDAHGGGGCSTGGGVGGGAIALVLLVLARRRRHVTTVVASLGLVLLAGTARADSIDNIVLTVFDPAPATTGTGFQLQSPEVGKDGDWVATATISHATNPLVLSCRACAQGEPGLRTIAVVGSSTLVELGGAYAFLGRFEAGARMSFYTQDGDPAGNVMTELTEKPATGTAAGDIAAHAKVRLHDTPSLKLGAGLVVTLPTSSDHAFTGVDKPSARLLALGTYVPNTLARRIALSANVGGILRAKARYANLEQGSGLAWGIGASARALDRVWVGAELFGDVVPSGRRESAMGQVTTLSPAEWLLGLRWFPDHRFSLALAAGRGLTSSAGSPELRGVLVLSFSPGAPEIRPLHAPEPELPDIDTDGDGIGDRKDKCPELPEDKDMFDDSDGCPDLDNDGDGILDSADKCPLDPEDKDGFRDDDGCPDKDNDGDGIPDAMDRCPNEPEDKDGFQDVDGCPDPDNDGDGVPDAQDRCPTEMETINGNKDDDGCPDPGDSTILLSPDRIETLDPIQFERNSAKITRASFNVLGQVAATLRAHREIVRVRVTAHIHPTTHWEKDQDLTDQRARAVRDWLVQWGIEAKRVEARGFGGTRPLAKGKAGESVNNRVEMVILERK